MQEIDLKTLLVLLMLRKEKIMGRYRLKEILDMREHEGIVRRMLETLALGQLVRPTRSGCVLTEMGAQTVSRLLSEKGIVDVEELDLKDAGIGPESAAIQLRRKSVETSIIALRDMAVKVGARGAIILTYKEGELGDMSVYRSLSSRHPEITSRLKRSFTLLEDDVVIVGFADTYPKALQGALMVGLEIGRSEIVK